MERWRALVPIALALIVAVIASFFIYNWMKKQIAPKEEVVKEELKTIEVAVAKTNLNPGTKITSDMLKDKTMMIETAPFLESTLPPGYFEDTSKLVGRIVRAPIKVKELVLESGLAPIDVKRGGMAAILTPGKRAVSVSGNKILGISGFINPGDKVDVLLLTTDPKTDEKINKTVFENVLVLATGTQLVQNAEGKQSPVDIYTLEVTPTQGERITLAAASGTLQFALRSVLDGETVLTTGATQPEILAAYRPIEPTKRVPSKNAIAERVKTKGPRKAVRAKRQGFTLEVIKGLNRQIQKF
jgi:pilus assembly protein CpaB